MTRPFKNPAGYAQPRGAPGAVLTDSDGVPAGTPSNPLSVNATLVSTGNASVGPIGSAAPAQATEIGGPDAGGVLRAPSTANANPASNAMALVVRDPTLLSGNALVQAAGTGTAGTPAAGVLTVQGIGGGVAVPVSGTVTVNQGTPNGVPAAWPTMITDGTNTAGLTNVAGQYALKVDVVQTVGGGGGGGGTSQADKSSFVEGTTAMTPVGGVYNEVLTSDPTEDQAAAVRITAKRGLHTNLRSSAGTEIGTAGAPLRTDPTGSTAQPVTDNGGSLTVDGTVAVSAVGGTVAVSAAALPLPTGASTLSEQQTQTTSLQLIDNLPHAMNAAFNNAVAAGGQLDDVSTTVATEDNVAPARITAQRALHTNLRNNAGTELATASAPLRTDPTGTTAQPVTDNAGSLTVDAPVGTPVFMRLSDGVAAYDAAKTGQLPSALVGGRLDANTGAWLGSTAPTVGQKAMASSVPVAISSDQSGIPVTDNAGSLTVDAPVGTPVFVRLSDGAVAYDGAKTGQLPSALVGGRLDANNGAWLGSTAPTVGQKAMAASLPVAIASDQGSVPVGDGGGSLTVDSTQLPAALAAGGGLKIEGVAGGVAVPVSGTVTANVGSTNGLALDATLTGGTQTSRITDGTSTAAVKAASVAPVATDPALVVAISPNSVLSVTATNPSVGTNAATAPTSSTQIGGTDASGNLQAAQVVAADPGADAASLAALGIGVVNDTPGVFIPGELRPLSLTTEGRLRVIATQSPTYMDFFGDVPDLTSKNVTPFPSDNPWG